MADAHSIIAKRCNKCSDVKPLSEFTFRPSRGAYYSHCNMCRSAAHKEWNEKNKERTREHAKKWRSENALAHRASTSEWKKQNPERTASQNRNRRAIRSTSEGTHTAEDIKRLFDLQRGCCAACFKKLGKTYHVDHRVALSRGGSNDWTNLQLLHPRCNLRKHARDPVEFMQLEHGLLL